MDDTSIGLSGRIVHRPVNDTSTALGTVRPEGTGDSWSIGDETSTGQVVQKKECPRFHREGLRPPAIFARVSGAGVVVDSQAS